MSEDRTSEGKQKEVPNVKIFPGAEEVKPEVVGNGEEKTEEVDIPELTGKDMNALMYILLQKVGTVEIPQEVFDTAPGPDKLRIERQWDVNKKVWRFFIFRKVRQKPLLLLPPKRLAGLN